MSVDHPWAVLPELVACQILTTEQARDVVMGQTPYNRIMTELQALCTDATSKGEDSVKVTRIISMVNKVQLMDTPNF